MRQRGYQWQQTILANLDALLHAIRTVGAAKTWILRESRYLPLNPKAVPGYLERRLQKAFDTYLSQEKDNTFARIEDDGWVLSKDPAEEFTTAKQQALERLELWLAQHMRTIKLPDLLVESRQR